jgi:hypothetical protein
MNRCSAFFPSLLQDKDKRKRQMVITMAAACEALKCTPGIFIKPGGWFYRMESITTGR